VAFIAEKANPFLIQSGEKSSVATKLQFHAESLKCKRQTTAMPTFAAMSKHHINQLLELQITDFAFGGKGIAKEQTPQGDKVIFVPNTIPGQRVQARVVKAKSKYTECKLVKILERSPQEIEQPYQDISGAPYTHLPLEIQQQYKKQSAFDLYTKIGKINDINSLFDEWIDSPEAWHYRNKMEYSFSAIESNPETGEEKLGFALGFKKRGSWWAVENLNRDSGLFDEEFENKLYELCEYLQETNLRAWNPKTHEGFYKILVVRKSFHQDQLLLNLITGTENIQRFDAKAFAAVCQEMFGKRIRGIIHSVNEGTGDRSNIEDSSMKLIYGEPKLIERLLDLEFEISIKSFFQPNPKCAAKLYTKALDYVAFENNIQPKEVILDLFCGTGTIAQLLAKKFPQQAVTGVDIEESAIKDARENAQRNGIEGLKFFAGDVGKYLSANPRKEQINTVVLDPPRGGIAPKSLQKVIDLNAARIVYISCNPATQARDCEILGQAGYKLKKLSLVDQFPHTAHVEAVALFQK
jgi:23S rRNA (uracil-5-)-methyltransferase RumA